MFLTTSLILFRSSFRTPAVVSGVKKSAALETPRSQNTKVANLLASNRLATKSAYGPENTKLYQIPEAVLNRCGQKEAERRRVEAGAAAVRRGSDRGTTRRNRRSSVRAALARLLRSVRSPPPALPVRGICERLPDLISGVSAANYPPLHLHQGICFHAARSLFRAALLFSC